MNGIHDLGGMHGFRLPKIDVNEPLFKEQWEKEVFAAAIAFKNPWPIDESRFAIESIPPREYLGLPYYGRWLHSFERLLLKYGLVKEQDLKNPERVREDTGTEPPRNAEEMVEALETGGSARRENGKAARFVVGEKVVVKNEHPRGHTRMPRYVRGRLGTIHLDHGIFVFPDTNSLGEGKRKENPQHCYNVMFAASELWGSVANARDRVYVDLWDDYLEPAT